MYMSVCVCRFTSLPLSYVRGENVNGETGQLNVLAGMNMCDCHMRLMLMYNDEYDD